ncbi:hypothetical protein ACOSQ2_007095 [Xanthoceras sorbifolium]
MNVINCCPSCGKEKETVLHALWLCKSLVVVRSQCIFLGTRPNCPAPSSSFLDFFIHCCCQKQDADLRLLAVSLWRLWFRRNRLIHENVALPAIDILNWSISFLAEFYAANLSSLPTTSSSLFSTGSSSAEHWKAPIEGWYKLNVDASLNNAACFVGLGAVVRDCHGIFMAGLSRKLSGLVSIEIAEAAAILNGLHLAIEFGFTRLLVESDALTVINCLSLNHPPRSEIG